MSNDLVTIYAKGIVNKDDVSTLKNSVAAFHKKLNDLPSIDMGNNRNGNDYIVISHIEMKLDEIFQGHWSTENYKYSQIANEIVGNITLKVLHPITGVWITREGAAAIQIMQDAGKPIDTILQTKKKNALETGFPKLKAMCLKNAASSLGKLFGRDLNRKQVAGFEGKVIDCNVISNDEINEIKDLLSHHPDIEGRICAKYGAIEFIPEDKYTIVLGWVKGEIKNANV